MRSTQIKLNTSRPFLFFIRNQWTYTNFLWISIYSMKHCGSIWCRSVWIHFTGAHDKGTDRICGSRYSTITASKNKLQRQQQKMPIRHTLFTLPGIYKCSSGSVNDFQETFWVNWAYLDWWLNFNRCFRSWAVVGSSFVQLPELFTVSGVAIFEVRLFFCSSKNKKQHNNEKATLILWQKTETL